MNFRGSWDILAGTNSQENPDDGGQPATYGLSDITVVCTHDSMASAIRLYLGRRNFSMNYGPLKHSNLGGSMKIKGVMKALCNGA